MGGGGGGGDNAAAAEAMTPYASTMRRSLSSTSHHTMLTQRRTQPCEPEWCCVKSSRGAAQIMVGLPASYITSAATMLATNIVCLSQPVTEWCVFIGGAMVLGLICHCFQRKKREILKTEHCLF